MNKKVRFRKLQEYGCVCCRMLGWIEPPDIHHLLSGGSRIGDEATIPLCPYHHRGVEPSASFDLPIEDILGPSLAHGSKPFETYWGTQQQMLEYVNECIR